MDCPQPWPLHVGLAKADIPHGMISKWWHGPSHSQPGAARRWPFRSFGPGHPRPHNFSSGLFNKKNNKLKLSNSLVLRMLSQHVHSFWHKKEKKKIQGLVFLECRICWLVGKFIFKNTFPVR